MTKRYETIQGNAFRDRWAKTIDDFHFMALWARNGGIAMTGRQIDLSYH